MLFFSGVRAIDGNAGGSLLRLKSGTLHARSVVSCLSQGDRVVFHVGYTAVGGKTGGRNRLSH